MTAAPRRDFPTQLLERRADAGRDIARFAVEVPSDLIFLQGHFPGFPILPGIAQIVPLALGAARRVWPDLGAPRRLSRLKFRQPIYPEQILELHLERREEPLQVRFRVEREGRICSEGALEFPPPSA
ncbi:MAG: hypothetical protein R3B09_03250 [Nannocystaceae bacterium]